VPFLIDWGTTPQPGLSDIPTIELVSLVRTEPDPALQRDPRRVRPRRRRRGGRRGRRRGFRLTLRTAAGDLVEL
jgi:hypothetical protein